MNRYILGGALALALSTTSLTAAPVHGHGDSSRAISAQDAQIWLAKNDGKGNGKAKGNAGAKQKQAKGNGDKAKPAKGPKQAAKGNGKPAKAEKQAGKAKDAPGQGKAKPEKAGKQKANGNENAAERAAGNNGNGNGIGNGNGNGNRRVYTAAEREEVVNRIFRTEAPSGRDMTAVLGGAGLALLTRDIVVSDIPDSDLITYANCPPGLAKKNPPCVPPGLVRDGVSYDDWVSYDRDRYNRIWIDRRDTWLGNDFGYDPDPDLLLLQSDQVERLFGLDPAPRGQRYAVIDGMPVLLDDADYRSLLLINQMAQVSDLGGGVPIAPTAALTQAELIDLYRLPQPGSNQNYAVVNGQLVQLNDEDYGLLQMLRVARAIL
ncbi:MAG: hypothetical protein ACE369_07655 [Roseovarius sp.]